MVPGKYHRFISSAASPIFVIFVFRFVFSFFCFSCFVFDVFDVIRYHGIRSSDVRAPQITHPLSVKLLMSSW